MFVAVPYGAHRSSGRAVQRGSAAALPGVGMPYLLIVARCQVDVSTRADHSSGGVLPNVVCLSVIVKAG
jgi:hypothetical protein